MTHTTFLWAQSDEATTLSVYSTVNQVLLFPPLLETYICTFYVKKPFEKDLLPLSGPRYAGPLFTFPLLQTWLPTLPIPVPDIPLLLHWIPCPGPGEETGFSAKGSADGHPWAVAAVSGWDL